MDHVSAMRKRCPHGSPRIRIEQLRARVRAIALVMTKLEQRQKGARHAG